MTGKRDANTRKAFVPRIQGAKMPETISVTDMPGPVKIGPWVYKVEVWHTHSANSANRFGECERSTRTIRVDNSYGPRQTAETLLHELLHAIYDTWCVDETDNEERTVRAITLGLSSVFVNNPGLAAWFERVFGG